jgi:hypothetical protein
MVLLVDADDGSVVAATDAGDVSDLDEVGGAGVLALKGVAKFAGAVEVAAHVVADADIDADGRLEAEVGVEAGDGVDVFDSDAAAGGDALDFFYGNEAEVLLHVAEVFVDALLAADGVDLDEDFGLRWHSIHPSDRGPGPELGTFEAFAECSRRAKASLAGETV